MKKLFENDTELESLVPPVYVLEALKKQESESYCDNRLSLELTELEYYGPKSKKTEQTKAVYECAIDGGSDF